MEEFKNSLGNLKVDQLGFVYKDIVKQAKIFESLFNVPKFAIIPEASNIVRYRGKEEEITTIYALSRQFNMQIELIQHISGNSVYKEFIDQGKEGLHHISIFVENLEAYIDYFEKQGLEMIFYGSIGKQTWAYFDTEETLGMLLELQETKKRKRKTK